MSECVHVCTWGGEGRKDITVHVNVHVCVPVGL